MGELDKQFLEDVKDFKKTLKKLVPTVEEQSFYKDLAVIAYVKGYNQGVEAMRGYATGEGLNLNHTVLISSEAKDKAKQE